MSGVNRVILLGNLGRDPEVKGISSGKKVANFSIATSETYKNKEGEKVTHTEWHNVVMWSPLAEIVDKYVQKGSQIYLEGKLTTRSYEKDGIKKYITEVVGRELVLLGNPTAAPAPAPAPAPVPATPETTAFEAGKGTPIEAEKEDALPF